MEVFAESVGGRLVDVAASVAGDRLAVVCQGYSARCIGCGSFRGRIIGGVLTCGGVLHTVDMQLCRLLRPSSAPGRISLPSPRPA